MKRFVVFLLCIAMILHMEAVFAQDTYSFENSGNALVTMYAPDGRTAQVASAEIAAWKNVGWYDIPVMIMYAPDGRTAVVDSSQVAEWKNVGWYDIPVTIMYAPDGRTAVVDFAQVVAWENVGWFREPVALMKSGTEYRYVIESEMEEYRINGWFAVEYSKGLKELATQINHFIGSKSGGFGVYIKNLNTGEYLILNDNQYSSASIIKLFVMAGIYDRINNGSIKKTNQIQSYLNSMITVSDNYSSNVLVKTMGGGNYFEGFNAENTHSESIGCINTKHKSLFIGYGDYVSYGKNVVSPYDCGLLLEKIYNRTLVSEQYSGEMLQMLKNQKRRNKIPYLLPKNTVCANKTGETSKVESDVGIVYSPNCDYIICVISNNANTGISDIRQISLMTYNYFNK